LRLPALGSARRGAAFATTAVLVDEALFDPEAELLVVGMVSFLPSDRTEVEWRPFALAIASAETPYRFPRVQSVSPLLIV
jgi:hypothetical protein